jgi:uncharacterized membrane protein YhaH (DUF805 family)
MDSHMGGLSITHLLITLVIAVVIYVVPVVMILRKAGYSGWWCLLGFVPIVNIVMLWVFAFATWPVLRQPPPPPR